MSHSSGARTLATWGAKIGEWQTTSAGRAVGDDLSVRQNHGAVGHARGELHVVGGQHNGMTSVGQFAQDAE